MRLAALILTACGALGLAMPVAAQDATRPGLSFVLKGGAEVRPEFPGSDDYEVQPSGGFSLRYLQFRNGFGIGDPSGEEPLGFRVTGAFEIVGEREESDLPNLDEIDTSIELGIGVGYRGELTSSTDFRVFGEVRQGVTGHDSTVGEVGADLIYTPTDRLTLLAGPRITYGSGSFNDTYFGVSAGESAASGLSEFDADSGLTSAGIELTARYAINDRWGVEGTVAYDRLQDDAADSPITALGSEDQYSVGINLTRRFTLDF